MFENTRIKILCGGRGSRLGKLTQNLPKPLLKLGKLSILEHKLNYYNRHGLNNYIFCTGYKGNKIEQKIIRWKKKKQKLKKRKKNKKIKNNRKKKRKKKYK